MRIKKVKIHSFGSILDQEVEFNDAGLATLEAINHDTSGASGAGKSMLFKSIEYVFGVLQSPAKNFENRQTKRKPHVELWFDVGEDHFHLERRLKTSNELKITKNGEVVADGGKEAEAYLFEHIIKMPKDFFQKILHKKQGEKSFFVNLTPKQSFALLSDILGLEKYESIIEKARGREREIESGLLSKENEMVRVQEEIGRLQAAIQSHKEALSSKQSELNSIAPEIESIKTAINTLSDKRNELNAKIKEVAESSVPQDVTHKLNVLSQELKGVEAALREYEAKKNELANQRNNYIVQSKSIESEVQNEISFLQKKIATDLKHKQSTITTIERDLTELRNTLAHLQESKCPVCLRKWDGQDFEAKLNNVKVAIEEKEKELQKNRDEMVSIEENGKKDIEAARAKLGRIEEVKRLLAGVEQDIVAVEQSIVEYKKRAVEIKASIDNIKQQTTSMVKQQVSHLSSELSDILNQIKSLESDLSTKQSKYNDLTVFIEKTKAILEKDQGALKELENKMATMQAEIVALRKEAKAVALAIKLTKSYTAYLFQSFLDETFSTANDILNKIPNASHVVIDYELSKEQKNGKVKDGEIVIRYNSGEYTDVSFDSFSGGEQTSIGLAIDLAFISTLSKQVASTNTIPSLWFLDEPFDGLDPISKMAFLEVINEAGRHALVVDHDKTVKDMAEHVLLVEKVDGVTSIKWM